MAKRFIVDKDNIKEISNDKIEIFGREVKHIQVLRYNINDEIKVNEYVCLIEKMTKISIVLRKIEKLEKQGEPVKNVTLYIALLKNEKLDYAIQKSVELGVKKIVPFISKNVIVKLDDASKLKRIQKLQTIANEACKQCGRTDNVEVKNILSFEDMLKELKNNEVNIFAYEQERKMIKTVFEEIKNNYERKIKNISCIIGPEGGFSESESRIISNIDDVYTVSLGERILRADTAAINMISLIMYEFEE